VDVSVGPLAGVTGQASSASSGAGTIAHVCAGTIVAAKPSRFAYRVAKRATDIVLATALLVVFAPAFVAIAIAIKLDSRGPVLFVHERIGSRRVGRNARGAELWVPYPFRMFKFRSMVRDADPALHVLHIEQFATGVLDGVDNDSEGKFKLHDDPRITRVGRFLRRTSIDELPQLLNVIRGEMTLVGPRPVPAYEVAHYAPADYERFTSKPGLTGLWQVSGRANLSFAEMIALDIDYVQRRSLPLDVEILAKTCTAVSSRRGAM
jgi:lipopolysaccharide/colanic/teichoic acid biosynthesis glycosyltransferase